MRLASITIERNRLRLAAIGLLGSTMLCASGTAFAQGSAAPTTPTTPAAAPGGVDANDDDIVVTAQKREENLQDVPMSIQALGTVRILELTIDEDLDELSLADSNRPGRAGEQVEIGAP